MDRLSHGLASLGRHGDSMLVHMNPTEVAGLQAIAMSHGGSLTINPHTGLPEAFNLGGFFSSLLPTIAGIVTAPMGGFVPLLAGAGTGALMAKMKGQDPLFGAVTGGFGGYSGSGLADTFGKMVGNTATSAATSNVGNALASSGAAPGEVAQNALENIGPSSLGANTARTAATTPNILQGTGSAATGATANLPGVTLPGATQGASTPGLFDQAGKSLSDVGSGIKRLVEPGGYNAFKAAGGTGSDLVMPLVMPTLEGLTPKPTDMTALTGQYKYDPNFLNKDIYLPQYAAGGEIDNAQGGAIGNTPGNAYSYADGTSAQNTPAEGYGLGRLNNLAKQQSLQDASSMGYAQGGYLDGPGDGMSDSIHASIEGNQPARLADGEFVVPADVVSHLGNGSSKAGSKRLYAMMDKVRQARTGHTKQGRQINPNKYLPA